MSDRSILYRLRSALQGGYVAVAREIELLATYVGILNGVNDTESALQRIDGTGIGASIFTFSGNYAAQSSNISEWFGNRQQTRLRCTNNGGFSPVTFSLPGSTALNTAFDTLVSIGLPETIRLVIEYTGTSTTFLRIQARNTDPGTPQIEGTTAIIVRENIAATVEVTRSSGTISNYVFQSIGGIGDTSTGGVDAVKLINPSTRIWDASASGVLPSNGVVKGNAYKVVNAPSDGSGRLDEIMQNDDWVVWEGETFTSWTATPHQWFVLPAHDVRRITALGQDFLTDIEVTPESDRNSIVRGAAYADSAGEIRLKIYTNRGDYSAADLNTTGDIDEYTNPTDQTGYLGIRLTGNQAALASTLPTLYVYSETSGGVFTRLLNLNDDFSFEGDFGAESDYLSTDTINYSTGNTLRIYVGSVLNRYSNPALDVYFDNLDPLLQARVDRTSGDNNVDEQRLSALESKMDALYPLTPDVTDLVEWADSFGPKRTTQVVDITNGYSLIADFRDASTRYESAGVTYDGSGSNVVRYTGLGNNLYRTLGFKVIAIIQISEATLTGTSGTANITIGTTDYLATFNTDLTTTASDFVTTHATVLNTAGVTVTSNAAVLTFTANVGGTPFATNLEGVTGDLAGSITTTSPTSETLLWIVDGSTLIPYVDMTNNGNYRINSYTTEVGEDEVIRNQLHRLTKTSGPATLAPGDGNVQTFTITNFPTNATDTSRTLQISTEVFLNGTDTQAAHFLDIPLPSTNTAQDRQSLDSTVNLGPLHGNRSVTVTFGYTLRVSGSDLLVDFEIISAPSDVTIDMENVYTLLNYTAPGATTRTDNFVTLQDAGGDYSFTGENELLLTFHPFTINNLLEAVPVAVNASGTIDELNDVNTPIPGHSFESVEIPDTIDFRTFSPEHFLRHDDLQHLLTRRNVQWCYGLALLRPITELSVTDIVDFTEGIVLIGETNNTRVKVIIDDSDTNNIKIGLQEL